MSAVTTLGELRKHGVLGPLDEHCARTLCRLAGEERPWVELAAALAVRQVRLGHVCVDLRGVATQPLVAPDGDQPAAELVLPAADAWLATLRSSPLVDDATGADGRRPLVLDDAGRLYLRRYWEHEQQLAAALRARAAAATDVDAAALESALDRLFGADAPAAPDAGATSAPSPASATAAANVAAPTGSAPTAAASPGVASDAPAGASASRVRGRAVAPGQLALDFDSASTAREETAPAAPKPAASSHDHDGDGPAPASTPDRQRLAARTAATRRLCVISGGPGTGKTSTVVKILALLVEQRARTGAPPPRVVLLAPTGKAAMRLTEAIRQAKGKLPCDDAVRAAIPEEASTIHRALGSIDGSSTRFRHHRDNPLRADVVLVDEASMVDLALMNRLVDAVPASARLILLGDKDQLASVEAGAVLGELCADAGARDRAHPLAASIVELTRSYRYDERSGIAALARAINAGDAAGALAILDDPAFTDVARIDPVPDAALSPALREDALAAGRDYLAYPDGKRRLQALERFRILCAHRTGPYGVRQANFEIEALLAAEGVIDRGSGLVYDGRPILVTRNDYQLKLFNGDVGTVVRHDGKLLAYFVAPDGKERMLSPARLPPHETVFAMTVHKSQGSEFDRVAVVLGDRSSPLLTRELLYTAVTRARVAVTLHATAAVVAEAIARRTERGSGLRDALWNAR